MAGSIRIVFSFLTLLLLAPIFVAPPRVDAQNSSAFEAEIERHVQQVMPQVVAWRRDIHEHPELSNREFRTAELVAAHLRSLGMEVETGIAHTGVVGVLRGGRPGPVVALRADMDALPVTELVDLPFASKARGEYNGQEVGVMHACGHDNHVAILLGTATVLAGMRDQLPGTVKFIFQPAEEGAPAGESGGASLMVQQGVLRDPAPEAIFGLHVWPAPVGTIGFRAGGTMASADGLNIIVHGRQTHGAVPWGGVDPIVVSAQIIMALQTISSRQIDLTRAPAIVTIGIIQGGIRNNIIPDSVVMTGTIRTFDPEMRADIHDRIRRTVTNIAEASGATAVARIGIGTPVTFNDPTLTDRMGPTLQRVAGEGKTFTIAPITGAEDFSIYQQQIPGLFFFLGIVPEGQDPATAPANHSPYFFADEAALPLGVRAMTNLAVDYLTGQRRTPL
jgi:amidohydrolase